MSDLPCINPDVSLCDLIREKQKIKGKITIAQISGKIDEIPAMKKAYKEVDQKIKSLETSAKSGNFSIRLM
jgi:hypothetical protein